MSKFEWIDMGNGKRRLVERREAPRAHPARSKVFPLMQAPVIKKSVAHVSRVLPSHRLEDGSPAIKGADGYTPAGEPIIESQRTIDRIRRLNPEYGLDYGDHVMDDIADEAGI